MLKNDYYENHFAYLSLNDEIIDFSKQYTNLLGLGLSDSTSVDNNSSPYNNSHLLFTKQAPGIAITNHSAPMKLSTINKSV